MIRGWLLGVVLALVLVWAIAFQWQRSRERLTADRTLQQVELRVAQDVQRGTVRPELLRQQVEMLRTLWLLDPTGYGIPLAAGSHYLVLGEPRSAIRWYERAWALQARPEIALNLSRAWFAEGDRDEAERYMDRVRVLDPQLARREGGFLRERPERRSEEQR